MLTNPAAGSMIREDISLNVILDLWSCGIPMWNLPVELGSHLFLWFLKEFVLGRILDPMIAALSQESIPISIYPKALSKDENNDSDYIPRILGSDSIPRIFINHLSVILFINHGSLQLLKCSKTNIFIFRTSDPCGFRHKMASLISYHGGSSVWPWRRIYDLSVSAGNCKGFIYDPKRPGIQINGIRYWDSFPGTTSMSI